MVEWNKHIFDYARAVYNIDKGRENTKNSENIGIKESARESVCRSVKDNGGSEK